LLQGALDGGESAALRMLLDSEGDTRLSTFCLLYCPHLIPPRAFRPQALLLASAVESHRALHLPRLGTRKVQKAREWTIAFWMSSEVALEALKMM